MASPSRAKSIAVGVLTTAALALAAARIGSALRWWSPSRAPQPVPAPITPKTAPRPDFVDVDATLAEAEKILRALADEVSSKLQGRPCFGKETGSPLVIKRGSEPPHVYISVEGGLVEMETRRGLRAVPQGDGLRLWVGIGVVEAPYEKFLPPFSRGAATEGTSSTPSAPLTRVSTRSFSLMGVVRGAMALEYPEGCDAKKLSPVWRALGKLYEQPLEQQFEKLWRNPPKDVHAAVKVICERARSPTTWHMGDHGEEDLYHGLRVYHAYKALQGRREISKLTPELKAQLFPALIALLSDGAWVLNKTPSDGPIIHSQNLAHGLLQQITGVRLPPPWPERRRRFVGRSPLKGTPPAKTISPEECRDRLQAWHDWWEEYRHELE